MKNVLEVLKVNKDYGNIGTKDGSRYQNIVVKMPKQMGADLAVGIGLIGLGVGFLVHNSFHRGANAFMWAEYDAQVDLGLIKNP